jgi:hypothetical protein
MPLSRAEAIVHVGLPKTGSTTIQSFLALNAESLSRQGVHWVPPHIAKSSQLEYALAACSQAGQLVDDAMFLNNFALRTLEDQNRLIQDFLEGLDQQIASIEGKFIISSEHIGVWMHTPQLRATLDNFLTQRFASVRYIMFVRPQTDFILSSYSESVKRGSARTLEAFVRDYDEINIHDAMTRWQAELGDRVRFAMLNRGNAGSDDLISVFCKAAEFSEQGLTRPAPSNESLPATALEILRRANAVIGKDIERNILQRLIVSVVRRQVTRCFTRGARLALSTEQAADINRRYPHPVESLVNSF